MSEEFRRALHEAAAGQPDVGDWVGPVRAGVRARRRRRAVQSAAAGTTLAVAAVLGLGALAGGARDTSTLEQADPTVTRSPVPTAVAGVPLPTVSRLAAPLATRAVPLPSRRPTDPAIGLPPALTGGDRDEPGPVFAAPSSRPPGPSATPRPTSTPRATSAPAPTRTPEPAPTAGTQQVVVEIAPAGTQYPAGRSTVTVTATGDGDQPPRVLALRVDGEPLAADTVLDCRYPTSPPGRSAQRATRVFEVDLPPGEHLLEAVADSGCSYYRGRGRTSRTVTAS